MMTTTERDYRRAYSVLLTLRAFENTNGLQREDEILRVLDDLWEQLADGEQAKIKSDLRSWAPLPIKERLAAFIASSRITPGALNVRVQEDFREAPEAGNLVGSAP